MSRTYDFELLIMRHGDAHDFAPQGGDRARELTEQGKAAIAKSAQAFACQEWFWSFAHVSPYIRAQQTAQIIHDHLAPISLRDYHEPLPKPKITDALIPTASSEALARLLIAQGGKLAGPRPRIAIFAHNPIVSALAGLLVGGDMETQIAMGRGDVVHLFIPAPSPFDLILDPQEHEPLPRAVLLGFYTSSALEALGARASGA